MKSSIRFTNNGNTIHATGAAAAALFAALTEPVKQSAKHRHVNNCVDDNCKDCGKDLRDDIHIRTILGIDNPPSEQAITTLNP